LGFHRARIRKISREGELARCGKRRRIPDLSAAAGTELAAVPGHIRAASGDDADKSLE